MVTLVLEGPDGSEQRLIVPAIFVEDLAYGREWGEVMHTVRLVADIFIIIVSIATLVSGVSGIMFAFSIIDLGLATGDLVIQSFAEEIAKLDGGKEFLDLW